MSHTLEKGVYRLTFDTAGYFRSIGSKSFYPEVSKGCVEMEGWVDAI